MHGILCVPGAKMSTGPVGAMKAGLGENIALWYQIVRRANSDVPARNAVCGSGRDCSQKGPEVFDVGDIFIRALKEGTDKGSGLHPGGIEWWFG